MGTGWFLWLRGPRAVQRELDRSDAQLAAARDALNAAQRAVAAVRAHFGDFDGEVVDLDAVRQRRRRSHPKVPVVALAAGTAALVAAAALITDARMIPFLPDPDADRGAVERADVEMEPAVSVSRNPDALSRSTALPDGGAEASAAGPAGTDGNPAARSGAGPDARPRTDLSELPIPVGPLPPLPLPDLPELPGPELPELPVPPLPPLPPPPTLPPRPQPPGGLPPPPTLPGVP